MLRVRARLRELAGYSLKAPPAVHHGRSQLGERLVATLRHVFFHTHKPARIVATYGDRSVVRFLSGDIVVGRAALCTALAELPVERAAGRVGRSTPPRVED